MTLELDDSQQLAVDLMLDARFGIVTGGPGTGKTTTLRTALDELDERAQRYRLAAPTGKAAIRIQQSTGREACTIHRLLGYRPGAGWTHTRHNPIDTDAIFVDEASMIDVELGAALFEAVDPKRTRIVLIGDANQLPPVGPGRVFADLVESGECPVARLTKLHRAAETSWMNIAAQQILRREIPDTNKRADFRFVEIESSADILPAVRTLVVDTFPKELGNPDVQVLIPQKPGAAGIEKANPLLQDAINPRVEGSNFLKRATYELRVGDRVIQTKNDYNLVIFNGEIGDVLAVSKDGVVVQYPEREPLTYTLEQANNLQLSYALTVHRTQGSEFPWVIVVCHSTHSYVLSPQLLYTAITRGKQGVVIVGDRQGLKTAVNGKNPPKRNTGLIERIRGEIAAA